LNNQGFPKQEFRASLGLIRLAESSFTAFAYGSAGLVTAESLRLIPQILPGVVIGVPIGAYLIRHVPVETFRRICMSFDAWIVAFGIATLFRTLHIIDGRSAYLIMAVVGLIDAWLLYRFFSSTTYRMQFSAHRVPSKT
jgi:uncharacterized protein